MKTGLAPFAPRRGSQTVKASRYDRSRGEVYRRQNHRAVTPAGGGLGRKSEIRDRDSMKKTDGIAPAGIMII